MAKWFHQRYVFDFTDTCSHVVKPIIVRLILSIAITHKWNIQQLDVNNAFPNGLLHEEVYMEQPKGFESENPSLVCKLNKGLYGLKQTPGQWLDRLQTTLVHLKFEPNNGDSSLFTYYFCRPHYLHAYICG